MIKLELYCGDRVIGRACHPDVIKILHTKDKEITENGNPIINAIIKKIFEFYTMEDLIKMTEFLNDEEKVILFYAIFDEVDTKRSLITARKFSNNEIVIETYDTRNFVISDVEICPYIYGGYLGGKITVDYSIIEIEEQVWRIASRDGGLSVIYSKKENTLEVKDFLSEDLDVETKEQICASINKLLKTLDALNRRKLALDENNNIIVFK